jgi:signal transduction histidine kinase
VSKVARRQIVVDRTFQLEFLRLWLVVGLGLIAISAVFYLFARKFLGAQGQMDPIALRVILGMSVFIVLFCVLMGTLSIAMAHRVAGAAYRIERSLDRMLEGNFQEPIQLRKGDYLTRIADRLNVLQESARNRRQEWEEVVRSLEDLRKQVPATDQAALEQLIQKAKTILPV